MNDQIKPLLEDKTYLRHFWHPVCTVDEFERANPSGHGPMGEPMVRQLMIEMQAVKIPTGVAAYFLASHVMRVSRKEPFQIGSRQPQRYAR